MCNLGWGEGDGAWLWRRPLRAWEEEQLGECRHFLSDIVLQPSVVDQWLWWHDPGGSYSVRGTYTFLTSRHVSEVEALTNLLWHKQIPLKVSVLAWRLLRNRLPTRDNLVRRHIITPDSQLCVTGCGGVETTHHLFLSCSVFTSLWHLIRVGLIHQRLIRIGYRTTSFSLFIQQGEPVLGTPSYSSYGSVAFGWCGKNEILGSSKQRNHQSFGCSRKSKYTPCGGWKLITQI
jgi:hypothetical protein